jgi:transglutaminase-like putative cysteine protease
LAVDVDLGAEMTVVNPFDFFLEPQASQYPFAYDAESARQLCAYVATEPAGPLLTALLADIPREATGTMEFLAGLNQQMQRKIGYVPRMEPGIQSGEDTLAQGKGSCRDSAWLLVQVARHLGLAARFVSGYLIQLAAHDGPAADFGALHAWAEVYLPGAGWVGFDPTSGLLASEGHIPLACTPDTSSAAPISGPLRVCKSEFHHEVNVIRT